MNSCRALFFVAPLVLLIVIAGCGGGGGGFDPNNVTVTVSPAAATVAANGQVTLQATVSGLCSSCRPTVSWSIAELASGSQCNWMGTTPPAGPCPDGTIQGAEAGSLTVTYHAPSTSGTFHVVAQELVTFTITKQATSVITVP
jgi:hypothetical protein